MTLFSQHSQIILCIYFYATDESFTANVKQKEKEKEREKGINIYLVRQILSIIEHFFRGRGHNS